MKRIGVLGLLLVLAAGCEERNPPPPGYTTAMERAGIVTVRERAHETQQNDIANPPTPEQSQHTR